MLSKLQEYYYPKSIEETLELLKNPESIILAGGSSISLERNDHSTSVIDLQKAGLNYIKEEETEFRIGAMTTAYELYLHPNLPMALKVAAKKIGDIPLLHGITIGGNLAKLYPYVDLPPILWALDARIVVHDPDRKEMTADEFFEYSKSQNVYSRRAMISEIILPKSSQNSASLYQSFTLIQAEKAQLNLSSYIGWDDKGTISQARFVVSGSTSLPTRITDLESNLLGKDLNTNFESPSFDVDRLNFLNNYKSSISYRQHILRVYIKRAIGDCRSKIGGMN